jgi:hypothetical protein
MSLESDFEAIPVGFDLGEWEMVLDEKTVNTYAELMQWQSREILDQLDLAPPGISINMHPRMQFAKFSNLKSAIWAKSEHEFLKPFRMGTKIRIRGRIVDKFIKRGRFYKVAEFETLDENGEVIMRSRETGINVE